MSFLIDGTTSLPENGDTGWGTTLNAAINSIDNRFVWVSSEAVAKKVAASGITGSTLASNVVSSSLTAVGTLDSLAVSGNVVIGGDFTVNGTTTTINTATLNVSDNIIVLNNDVTGGPTENAGIEVERGTSTNVLIRWNETTDVWELTNDGAAYSVINAANALSGTTLASNVVSSSLTSVGTIATGVWNGTAIAGQYGGTGVANTGKTITVSGNTTIGSSTHTVDFTTSGNTSVALPTTGTLATLAGSESLTNKKLGSLTTNGLVTTSSGDGTLSVTAMGANVATFLGTPSSANLASAVSDETGSGALVFGTSPAITSPAITTSLTTPSTSFDLINTTATTVNFARAATALTIGANTGTTAIQNALTVGGTTTLGPAEIQTESASFTATVLLQGKIVQITGASNIEITVPAEGIGQTNFPIGSQITFIRNTSGTVQFVAGAGVTLRSDASKFFISTQYSAATLIKFAADEWYVVGNLAAS
jgi:hypothetical protein